jgi:hypothetical protein
MILVAMDDNVRSLMLPHQLLVRQNTGKFDNSVFERVQTTHLQIHPQIPRLERQTHLEIVVKLTINKRISNTTRPQ